MVVARKYDLKKTLHQKMVKNINKHLLCIVKSTLHGRIKELNHMVALHDIYFLGIVSVNNIQI